MTFRELLDKYRAGQASEEERALVEAELEKSGAIADYLAEQVEDALQYIKENDKVTVKSYKGVPFSVECENFVVLRVTQADPSVKGNTATNATKDAILETGAKIQVPMFVNEGELIRIDTRTGEYMERVKG